MVKTKGATLVVLATLLAGFVASCAAGDLPSAADIQPAGEIQPGGTTAQAGAEDEPSGLTSSPESLTRPAPTGVPNHHGAANGDVNSGASGNDNG